MKKFVHPHTMLLIVCFSWIVNQAGAQKLEAGAAEIKINPPLGSYLAGYQQNRKSTGVHDDLFVKSLPLTVLVCHTPWCRG